VLCSSAFSIKPVLTHNGSPAHAYTYPFEPNAEWSSFYAGAPEILQYFQNFAKKYDLNKYIKFNSSVKEAVWNEEEGKCG
jgi:cation diffusion facilitator CzcD-associated flavoprotein CzcO